MPQSPTDAAASRNLSVTVDVNLGANTKTLTFNKPVSTQEASSFLWGHPANAALLKPIGSLVGGKAQKFTLETHDVATIMSLKPEVRNAIIQGSVLGSNAKPYDFPRWVPKNIQDDIRTGKLPKGVKHYPGPPEWGDIVVWTGNATVQIYMEFPSSLTFYSRIAKDDYQARLLHFAYTEYNKDMHHFVDEKGFSPEDAKSEIRRINEEVFKLIIESAVAILTSGVGISQVNNAMRFDAEQVSAAARRSPRCTSQMAPVDISNCFVFRPRWRQGSFEYEELSGELGVPGQVVTHRDVTAQRVVSAGTGEHAGHRIGIQFGAPGDARNLSLQNPNMNTFAPRGLQDAFRGPGGSYHDLESLWAQKLKGGSRISVTVRDKYRIGESRPISRWVQWTETTPKGEKLGPQSLDFGNFPSAQSRAANRP